MKRLTLGIATTLALALSEAALAQQREARDLEVTISVVPADARADAATREIALPASAAPQAHDNAKFGLDTANQARELRRDFGQDVAEQARERAQDRIPNIERPKAGRP